MRAANPPDTAFSRVAAKPAFCRSRSFSRQSSAAAILLHGYVNHTDDAADMR